MNKKTKETKIPMIRLTDYILPEDKDAEDKGDGYIQPHTVCSIAFFDDFIGLRFINKDIVRLTSDNQTKKMLTEYFKWIYPAKEKEKQDA